MHTWHMNHLHASSCDQSSLIRNRLSYSSLCFRSYLLSSRYSLRLIGTTLILFSSLIKRLPLILTNGKDFIRCSILNFIRRFLFISFEYSPEHNAKCTVVAQYIDETQLSFWRWIKWPYYGEFSSFVGWGILSKLAGHFHWIHIQIHSSHFQRSFPQFLSVTLTSRPDRFSDDSLRCLTEQQHGLPFWQKKEHILQRTDGIIISRVNHFQGIARILHNDTTPSWCSPLIAYSLCPGILFLCDTMLIGKVYFHSSNGTMCLLWHCIVSLLSWLDCRVLNIERRQ
jgi:hypothetical protein